MNPYFLYGGTAQFLLCATSLGFLLVRKQWKTYWQVGMFLAVRGLAALSMVGIVWMSVKAGPGFRYSAYRTYFYLYWAAFAIESILTLLVLDRLISLALAKLEGMRRFGTLLFRWIAVPVCAAALAVFSSPSHSVMQTTVTALTRMRLSEDVLTVCVLAGLLVMANSLRFSSRSKVVGLAAAFGLLAAIDLLSSLLPPRGAIDGKVFVPFSLAALGAILVYFSRPEPDRGELALAGTSRLMRWNEYFLRSGAGSGL